MNGSAVRKLALFVVIGGFAATVNVAARAALDHWLSYDASIVVAFFVALTVAFTLNRRLVFGRGRRPVTEQYGRFFLVNLAALAQVWLVSVGLARYAFPALGFLWHPETVAHAIGVVSPVATSYVAHKHFSFR